MGVYRRLSSLIELGRRLSTGRENGGGGIGGFCESGRYEKVT